MGQISELYQWTWRRLPRTFTFPLLACFFVLALLIFFVYPTVCLWARSNWPLKFEEKTLETLELGSRTWVEWSASYGLLQIFLVLVLLAFLALGLLLSYLLAVWVYSKVWRRRLKAMPRAAPSRAVEAGAARRGGNLLADYQRIGIILAGGGAKGAYQAGALTAIHEFLEEQGALGKVKMIAGSSIGSWNALFWLADLIGPPSHEKGRQHPFQRWWGEVDVGAVIRPAAYIPARRNYFLSNEPWRESFKRIFADEPAARARLEACLAGEGGVNFYFTRANVEQGTLEFVTNRTDFGDVLRGPNLPGAGRPRPAVARSSYEVAKSVEEVGEAVFSSMDLPPLFEYARDRQGRRFYEDGGVVDNLPIRFGTELEKCDLLFVLPLNANFEEEVNLNSVVKRLYRVLNVRQGVLERNALKMVYLYNELAALRGKADTYRSALRDVVQYIEYARARGEAVQPALIEDCLREILAGREGAKLREEPPAGGAGRIDTMDAAECALRRRHGIVRVFSVCPAPKLIVDTASFWKTSEAARAFDLMYCATRDQLDLFDFTGKQTWVRMAQISPAGAATYLEDF